VIQKPLKIRWYIALNVVIGLSGSRSGAVAGLLVAFYFFNKTMTKKSMLILRLGISGLAFLALLLTFLRRGSSITQTDRFLFYEVFLSETKEKEFYSWLFGNIVIRPLSEFGCNRLNYYQILISDHTFGTCYSVILHSFVLRILWDFGIFGLIISFLAIFSRLNGLLPKPMPQIFVFLALINAASVSGPNNVYVVFPILLAILAANNLGSSKRNLKFPTEKF
jgi:hypothetical protein